MFSHCITVVQIRGNRLLGDLSAICAASALGDFTLIEEGLEN